MNQTFSIPEPCHEAWDAMTPNEQGRHCGQCCKTVIDFSGWSTDEITAYLFAQRETSVCGRMRAAQVAETQNAPADYVYQLLQSGMDFFKKVAAILLFAVCIGEAAFAQQPAAQKDTLKPMIMGKMMPIKALLKIPKPVVTPKPQQHITGLIAPAPYPTPAPKKESKRKE